MFQDKEFKVLRITKGRLNYRRGDLSLYILEPNQKLYFDSVEIYEEAYNDAYMNGNFLREEVENYLLEMGTWTPFDDSIIEDLKKEIEKLKVEAFKSFFNKKKLAHVKMNLRNKELEIAKLSMKKQQYDKYTCENIAIFARWNWLIEKSTFHKETNELYNWQDMNISDMINYYEENSINPSEFRELARSEPWRSIWAIGKKTGNLFGISTSEYTKDQITLCSYSMMYDNVYENPEQPEEAIINDDDCLDGWFIVQKKKADKAKKENEVHSKVTNKKIAGANEIFIMADSGEEAERINSINPDHVQGIKRERMEIVKQKGMVTDVEFADIKMQRDIQATQALINRM